MQLTKVRDFWEGENRYGTHLLSRIFTTVNWILNKIVFDYFEYSEFENECVVTILIIQPPFLRLPKIMRTVDPIIDQTCVSYERSITSLIPCLLLKIRLLSYSLVFILIVIG